MAAAGLSSWSSAVAAYWAEALGSSGAYSDSYDDETSVVKIHSGNGEHDEMNVRAIACFDQAPADVGISNNSGERAGGLVGFFGGGDVGGVFAKGESAEGESFAVEGFVELGTAGEEFVALMECCGDLAILYQIPTKRMNVMRTFVKPRQLLATHEDLAHRLDNLEWRESERDGKVQYVFETIQHLIEAPQPEPKRRIGFPLNAAGAAQ